MGGDFRGAAEKQERRRDVWGCVGARLLHGVVACFTEVQTWPLRACGRESQLGRLLMARGQVRE